MIHQVALTPFLGQPVFLIFGMLTLISLLTTATVGYLNFRGNTTIPFKWHPPLAGFTITIALLHALMALSLRFNF